MNQRIHHVDSIYIFPSEENNAAFSILVYGNTYTRGWSDPCLVPCFRDENTSEGIYEFSFMACAPEKESLPVTTEVNALFTISPGLSNLKTIRVYAESNTIDAVPDTAGCKERRTKSPLIKRVMEKLASPVPRGPFPELSIIS